MAAHPWSLEGMEADRQEVDPWLLGVAWRQEETVGGGTSQEGRQSPWAVEQMQAVLLGAVDQNRSLLEEDHLQSRKLL